MRIGVIGGGSFGGAMAAQLAAAGHDVSVGSRDASRGPSYAEVAQSADAVVLAVPWQAVPAAIESARIPDGAILINCSNPFLDDTFDGDGARWSRMAAFPEGESGALAVARLAPQARVVLAFNTLYADAVRAGPDPELPAPAVFLCGDDSQAKATVAGLARSLGYDPVDAGKLAVARYVEPLCGLMVELDDPELVISVSRPRPE